MCPANGLALHCGLEALVSGALGFGMATWHHNAESDDVGRTLLHHNLSKSSTLNLQSTVSLDK